MTVLAVREAAVAGVFYPARTEKLRRVVEAALSAAKRPTPDSARPKALVVPHAGYDYSAVVAASAYARVVPFRDEFERVVLLGPAHRVPLTAVGASSADAFATPLGLVPADTTTRDALRRAGLVEIADGAHAGEHSLEVQLPFLQVVLGAVPVLPLAVGALDPDRVAAVLDHVWGGAETLIVVSTDLSHYHEHGVGAELDRQTAAAVLARRPDAIGPDRACGVFALRGLLLVAAQRDLEVEQLDLRSSGDTAGDRRRVVGYGAFAFSEVSSE